ncbi:MAG: hypothetical protein OEY36_03620 [Gammaproteobacteria bacterium]|nr:hypothetical protein [Gammaproteobacteria bacterium]
MSSQPCCRVVLFLLLVLSQPIKAETPAQQTMPVAEKSACDEKVTDNEDWIDFTHRYLNESLCLPAEWVDSFFSTERLDEEVKPGSYVRWINDFVQTEGGEFNYVTIVRANLRLPKASHRLKLVIEGEQEDSLNDVISVNEDEVKTNVGLLYELFQSPRSNLGLKLNLSPELVLRYRYSYPFTNSVISRFTQDFFKSDDDAGSESRLDLEKRFNQALLLRWTNSYADTDLLDGIERISSLVLYQRLTESSALSYEAAVSTLSLPEYYHTNERLAIRYRRNFYRKWLFYELVPELSWPKLLPSDPRQQINIFTFRLEIKFNSISG